METMRDVFSEIVDYAGLFPPATCTMAEAVRNYHAYRTSSDRWMLGAFVVAAARLEELSAVLQVEQLPLNAADPWRLAVVMGVNIPDGLAEISEFRTAWAGRGVSVAAIEYKVSSPGQVLAIGEQIPATFRRYLEVPIEGPYRQLLGAISRVGALAKVRTGGTTPELFPTAEQLTLFLLAATRERVAFKATAGLHHPIRGEFHLTYVPDAPRHVMYGFVNVLLATAELARGGDGETAQAILEDDDPTHFVRAPDALTWCNTRYRTEELLAVRETYFLGFGSCSFREPVEELQLRGSA
jgi:hypothetical protein